MNHKPYKFRPITILIMMAKSKSLFEIDGTLGNVTFYRSNGQNYAKTKGSITKKQIMGDKAFQRLRENMQEFAGSAKAGKAFREIFAGIVKIMQDSILSGRVTKMMKRIVSNGAGRRGEREINIEGYGYMLNGLEFNDKLHLSSVFYAPYAAPVVSATRDSIQLTVADFDTDSYLRAPQGATHFKLLLAGGLLSNYAYQESMNSYEPIDPDANAIGAVSYSSAIKLGGDVGAPTVLDVDLSAVGIVPVTSMFIGAVGIVFYQQVNSELYVLAASNAMRVAVVG